MDEIVKSFVSHVGTEPASYVQASFLVGGKVLTFRHPVVSLSDDDVVAAVRAIIAEVAKVG